MLIILANQPLLCTQQTLVRLVRLRNGSTNCLDCGLWLKSVEPIPSGRHRYCMIVDYQRFTLLSCLGGLSLASTETAQVTIVVGGMAGTLIQAISATMSL